MKSSMFYKFDDYEDFNCETTSYKRKDKHVREARDLKRNWI